MSFTESSKNSLVGAFIGMAAFVLFFSQVLLFPSPASAAPHFNKLKPEPTHGPGIPFAQRLAGKAAAAKAFLTPPATYPYSAKIFFLKVDFPPDSDSFTFGTGEWTDPAYAVNGNSDYWMAQDKSQFIAYYNEVSNGLLSISVVESAQVYRMPKKMRDYGDESTVALESLIYDAITTAMTSTTNQVTQAALSTYDAVLIVHAGAGEETDSGNSPYDIWSLYYSNPAGIAGLTATLRDGNPITEAILMPQTDTQDSTINNPRIVDPLGVYVHEFGHWLGLPDLYCTDGLFCIPDGLGEWSLMADGIYNKSGNNPYGSSPAHPDAWCKYSLGWINPVNPQTNPEQASSFALSPVETGGAVYMLPVVASDPAAVQQYYLLENRQRTGFDAGIPGHGLLVWLVDEAVTVSRYPSNTINNSATHPGVKLIEADGDYALLKFGCSGTVQNPDDCGSNSDPFPGVNGVTLLTPVTNPSATAYSPDVWVNLRNISEDAVTKMITLEIGFGPRAPQNVVVDGAGLVTWTTYSGPVLEPDAAMTYNVYRNGSLLSAAPLAAKEFTDPAPQGGVSYQVTGIDASGNESALSQPAYIPVAPSKSGPCFIATAAYGSFLDPHVRVLREFRDRYLLTNAPGRAFVTVYYRWSPPLAEYISRHEFLRSLMRTVLAPVVTALEYPLIGALMLIFGMAIFTVGLKKLIAGGSGSLSQRIQRTEK